MSLLARLFNREPNVVSEAVEDTIVPLPELLLEAVREMSRDGCDIEAACSELALELRERKADFENVRAIVSDVIYEGDVNKTDSLMTLLARYGFGAGAVTVQQPDRVERKETSTPQSASDIGLYPRNLFRELAISSAPYSAVLLGDRGTGLTTLIQALISEALNQPCTDISITVLDFIGEPDWKGLAAVPNTLAVLSSRDKKFLETAADYMHQMANEVQQRHAQRTVKQRSSSLGRSRWPAYFLALNGWQVVSESLENFTPTQIQQHSHVGQLLADFKYCLTSGPKVNVTVVASGDRIENMSISQTVLDSARVFAIGAIHSPGIGGYRAVDALVTNKNRIPDADERKGLKDLLAEAKVLGVPVVLALSGSPRLGWFNDFRDESLQLGEKYRERKGA